MKNNYYIRLVAGLCVAGLTTCMLSVAKAEAPAAPNALSLLQNEALSTTPSLLNSAVVAPGVAFSSYNKGIDLPTPTASAVSVQSSDPILHYTVIPEPTSVSCLLLGLGVLVGFKRLKIGRAN
jgi:hypothetical protein